MSYFDFVFTQDGSTGLYNHEVEDIYHSVFGAKSEAEDKFITPLQFSHNFLHKKEIKVLDICYGIGYNTKALLKKTLTSDYKGRVFIDALECDKNLVLISPFIKDGYFKKFPEISYFILSSLIELIHKNKNHIFNILSEKSNKKFFEPFYRDLLRKYKNLGYTYDPTSSNNRFLHNI